MPEFFLGVVVGVIATLVVGSIYAVLEAWSFWRRS